MSQLLTLSRAAQLIGVSRHELQRQVRNGELVAPDGMVASDELLRCYPDVRIDEASVFEPAVPFAGFSGVKCGRERILPSKEVLARRLFGQTNELADLRRHLARYHDLIEALQAQIAAMPSDDLRVRQIGKTIDDGLATVLGSQEPADRVAVLDEMLRVVAAQVSIRPSGHEFLVEGSETILEAALHAGLAPAYGCGNGNCGLCKARVIEGEVRQVRNYDYALSAAEQAQNYTLLCSHTAVSDLVIEMVEALTPADIPQQEVVVRVKSVSPLDDRTYQLRLQSPRSNRLRFLAGQRVTLGIHSHKADWHGDHAIASCPCDEHNLMFHISRAQADAGDGFAAALFAGAIQTGDAVNVRGPYGEFVLNQRSPRAIAFVCCDTGYAPVQGLIEHALAMDSAPALALFWATTRPDGQYRAGQCRAWAAALDNFRYSPIESGDATAVGQATLARIAADIGEPANWDFYVSGSEAFVAVVTAGLAAAGVAAAQLVSEAS
jgi:CDP-4-dehydro-6-deoxyglucose reductase, E3